METVRITEQNIDHMDKNGYSFVIMVRGMADLASSLILENKGSFESKRSSSMDGFGVYGKTVKRRLYESDTKERFFYIYHSISKEASEKIRFEEKLKEMHGYMMKHKDEKITFGSKYTKYYYLHYDKDEKIFLMPEEKTQATERELNLCGYL